MTVVHLTSSRFYGGPERQMLGLALALQPDTRTVIVSFGEGGRCMAFLDQVRHHGVHSVALRHDTPHLLAARRELIDLLRAEGAAAVCCHGYKANLLGRSAARQCGIPALAVSRGWTSESWRVRVYETIDRVVLRWMDHVVCVSAAQADKVRASGVRNSSLSVIANSIRVDRFGPRSETSRAELQERFARPRSFLIGAAGRLSPEKGFDVLLEATARVARHEPDVGLLLFGDGPLRPRLEEQIAELGLANNVVLAGFHNDLDRLLPALDLFVQSSFTEGMPNVLLEAMAARLPIVATAVGGTPELVEDGVSGWLAPAGDAAALGRRMQEALAHRRRREAMGQRGRERVEEHFTFAAQARRYREVLQQLGVADAAGATADLQAIG